ncbi:MAG: PrsW family intramembrane metalloprotease [Spirochaetes bacterium]|nr:PrsW family intramembrane metalloprotease [Spirochaetota bacterium]
MPWSFATHLMVVILVPILLFTGVYIGEKRAPAQSPRLGRSKGSPLILAFLGGGMIAFPVLALLLILPPWKGYGAYLRVAAVEEVGKAILPMILVRMRGTVSIRKTILLFVASALGFSLLENLLFLMKDPETSFFRSFTSVPLHGALSAIFGFAHGFSRFQYKSRTFWGGIVAILLHGMYNAGWEFSIAISVGVLIVSFTIAGSLWIIAQRIGDA